MSRIIVTGGAGFIGSHVTEKLLERGHRVFVVDNLSGGYIENIPSGAYFFNSDCSNYEQMKMIFDTVGPEVIFHLCAYAAEGLAPFVRRYNCRENIEATVNIVNLSVLHKVKRLIYTSSMAVYGSQQVPYSEDMTPNPEDPYGWAKFYCEGDIKCASKMWDLETTVFRPHSVIGIRQNIHDSYRNVASILTRQALHEQPLTVFGDGSQVRSFSHISDICSPIVDSISGAYPEFINETYNIGGDFPTTILELALEVQKVAKEVDNKDIEIVHLAPRVEVHTAYSSHDKLRKFYPYKSGKTLHEMIVELYAWARVQPTKELFTWRKEDIEITEKLPSKWADALR